MSKNLQIDRRRLMQLGMYGLGSSVLLEQLGGVPLLGTYLDQVWAELNHPVNRHDAFAMMGDALRGGPAIFGVHRAMAQADTGWVLVQIKLLNHNSHPLVFRLGQQNADGSVTTGSDVPLISARTTLANTYFKAAGVDAISDMPRYAALRLNKWFADMLHNGTKDGKAAGTGNTLGLGTTDIAPIDPSKVAIQTFMHLSQINSNNHALKGCKLRDTQPDLALFASDSGLIASPLGITCFMMGTNYDRAEGSIPTNAVLTANGETAAVNSRSVNAYVGQIGQFVGNSYADRAPLEQNVIYKMDQLVQSDPVLRRDLVASIAQFQSGLTTLQQAGALESARQTNDNATANTQADDTASGKVVGASTEFLAQVKYVCASLALPGMPVRNFSLFCNATDLDGGDLDKPTDGGGGNQSVKAYSYLEAHRQLAMGLNMLANQIAQGAKMVVVVHSEGGRAADLTDSKTSWSMVMAPGGAGMLQDALYCNMATINQASNAVVKDPGQPTSAVAWDTPGLCEGDGTASASTTLPTTGDVQLGLVEFLEGQTGVKARTGLSGSDARFVKLKRA